MALTRGFAVLLGHAVFFLRSGFAERPAVSHISLQTDSIDGSTVEEMADLSHRMGVYSRAAFEVLPSNGSSLIQKAETGPPHTCTATDKIRPEGGECCTASIITEKLRHLPNYKPVMDMTNILAGCNCLCGSFGTWNADQATLTSSLSANGIKIEPEDYAKVTARDGHTCPRIKPGGDVVYEQLHVLADKQSDTRQLEKFLKQAVVFRDSSCSGEQPCAERTTLTETVEHFKKYQTAKHGSSEVEGTNLGIWHDSSICKVNELIGHITHWGSTNGVQHLVPRVGQPVMDYQLTKLIEEEKIEPGRIETCIEEQGVWKEVPQCFETQSQRGYSGSVPVVLSSAQFGTVGMPKANEPVKPYQLHVLKRLCNPESMQQILKTIRGKANASPGALANARELGKHIMRYQDYGEKPDDPHWHRVTSSGKGECADVPAKEVLSPLSKAKEACLKDKTCCFLSATTERAVPGPWNRCSARKDGGKELFGIRRSTPDPSDILTIEVAMNFQGKLDRHPLVWKDRGNVDAETERMEVMSGFFKCPAESVCECGCASSGNRCGDPFNGHRPKEGDLVTAEQAGIFYYYGVDITTDTNSSGIAGGSKYVEAGVHWKWKSAGLTWLATKRFDLPGAEVGSSGPAEEENVTPYQLHFLLQQAPELKNHGDIMEWLASQGEEGYVMRGSPGLKPCDTKQHPEESRDTAQLQDSEETPLILRSLNKDDPKASDAPMGNDEDWSHRADDVDQHGRISGNIENLDPHSGEKGHKIPKTHSYDELLKELQFTEKLRKEPVFAGEFPIYWEKGYRAWKLNQDVRQLENKYLKDLYITSNAASKIVKKEYDVDNRLTSNVTTIVENEKKHDKGTAGQSDYWESALKPVKVNVKFNPEEGEAGLEYDDQGVVTEVESGKQGEKAGVQEGWKVLTTLSASKAPFFGLEGLRDVQKEGKPYESTFMKAASNSKLKYFTDWNHDSKLSQVHALHAYKEEGRPLLTDKEIDKDLEAGGKFAGTVTTVGKNEMQMMVNRRMTAMMAGERVRFKLSPHVATILSNEVLREIQTSQGDARTAALKDFPHPEGFISEGDRGNTGPSQSMAMAAFEYILDDPPYKVNKKTNGQIDCDFSQNMAILSKFNHYLVDKDASVKLENIIDSEYPTYWQIRPILQWKAGISAIVVDTKLQDENWIEAAGAKPADGDVVQPGQIFLLWQNRARWMSSEENLDEKTKEKLDELNPNLESTLFQPPVGASDSGAFTIRSVPVNRKTGNQAGLPNATLATIKEYAQDPRFPSEDKVGHWLSWSGSINSESGSKEGGVQYTNSAGFGATEVWAIADDGYGGLAISAYQTGLFNKTVQVTAVKTNLLDENQIPILRGKGVRQPWMLLTKEGAPGCKVTVELKSPPPESKNLEKKYNKNLLGDKFQKFQEFLHSIQPQDLEEANGIKSQQPGVEVYLRPSARLLDYVRLDKTRAENGKLTEEALGNLIRFFTGPWQILNHGPGGVEVALKGKLVIYKDSEESEKYEAGEKLKEMKKKDGTALWSASGHIKDSDLAVAADRNDLNSLGGVIEEEMKPWKHPKHPSGHSVE